MTVWKYNGALDRLQLSEGCEVEVAGHRLWHFDLESGPVPFEPPRFMFVDPPYSAGLARGYRTKAGVDGDSGRAVDFDLLLDRIMRAAGGAPVVMEGSVQPGAEDLMRAAFERAGYKVLGRVDITYGGKTGRAILVFGHLMPDGVKWPEIMRACLGQDDEVVPEIIMTALLAQGYLNGGDVVADPCTGRGLTPVTADRLGLKFVGTELSHGRLAVAVEKLAEQTGQPVTLQ